MADLNKSVVSDEKTNKMLDGIFWAVVIVGVPAMIGLFWYVYLA